MTTKEIDNLFTELHGVEQFVIGNIALERHGKFFLNLTDDQKLEILNNRGPLDQNRPVVKPVIKSTPGCPSSFGEDPGLEENKGWCRRRQGPDCKGCLHHVEGKLEMVKDKKANAPVQMGLW